MHAIVIIGLAMAVTGCATITRGSSQPVTFTSTPSGAEARTSLGLACVTPCTMQMERKKAFAVTLWKEGYEPQTIDVSPEVGGEGAAGVVGNVIAGGIVGIGVDAISGAGYDLKPNPVSVVLRAEPAAAPSGRHPAAPATSKREPPPFPAPPKQREPELQPNT